MQPNWKTSYTNVRINAISELSAILFPSFPILLSEKFPGVDLSLVRVALIRKLNHLAAHFKGTLVTLSSN